MLEVNLPPGVTGAPRGQITLTIDEIIWSNDSQPVPCGVKVVWWGQSTKDSVIFSPVDVRNFLDGGVGSTQVFTYSITTSEIKLSSYLTDASPLLLNVQDVSGAVLGNVSIQDLARIIKVRELDGYYPVLAGTGDVIANLHVRIVYGEAELQEQQPPKRISLKESEEIKTKQKAVIKSRSKDGKGVRSNPSSPAKVRSCLTPNQSPRMCRKNQRNRVTFSEDNKVYNHDSFSENVNRNVDQTLNLKNNVDVTHLKKGIDQTPISDNLVADLLNQSQVLRETLRQQLKENDLFELQEKKAAESARNLENLDTPSDDELLTIEYDMSPMESDDEGHNVFDSSPLKTINPPQPAQIKAKKNVKIMDNFQSKKISEKENVCPDPSVDHPHLTWNLTVSRLKYLSQTNQVSVSLSGAKINDNVLDSIKQGNVSKPSFVPAAGAGVKNRREGKQPAVSVFVKYSLPGDKAENNLCSRKIVKGVFQFKEKSLHQVIFNTKILDLWWTSDIHLKVYSRLLSQRVPFYLGESTLSLKYLLMHDKYSNGSVLSLPVYASQSLFKSLKMEPSASEIIGHIEVSFLLGTGAKFQNRPISPQKPVRDRGAGARHEQVDEFPNGLASDLEKLRRSALRETNLNNNSPKLTKDDDGGRVTLESSIKGSPVVFPSSVLYHLNVSAGRVEGGGSGCQVKVKMMDRREVSSGEGMSLVETDALFLPGEVGKTHNRRMLDRLKENYLMVELWRGEDTLLGLGKVPTDAIYQRYQSGQIGEVCVAFDDWVHVVDVVEGKTVGELKVLLCAGTHRQIDDVKRWEQKNGATQINADENDEIVQHGQNILNETITLEDGGNDSFEVQKEPVDDQTDGYDTPATSDYSGPAEDSIESTPRDDVPVSEDVNKSVEITNGTSQIRVQISVEEARNLPLVLRDNERVAPTCYTSLPDQAGGGMTDLVWSQSPSWGYNVETLLDTQLLLDPRRHLILKVWHHQGDGLQPDPLTDQVLGFAAVDLAPLLSSFPRINGWYNIMNWVGKCRGQIKVSVTPLVDLNQLQAPSYDRRLSYNPLDLNPADNLTYSVRAEYSKFPSHVVQHTEQIIQRTTTPSVEPGPEQEAISIPVNSPPPSPPTKNQFWNPPTLQNFLPDDPTRSFLESSLQRNLSDLDTISRNIQNRLYPPAPTSKETIMTTVLGAKPVLEDKVESQGGSSESCLTYTVNSPKFPVSMSFIQNHISDNLEALRQLTIGGQDDTGVENRQQKASTSPASISPQQFRPILSHQVPVQDTQEPQYLSGSSNSSDHIPRLLLPQQLSLNVPGGVGWDDVNHLDQMTPSLTHLDQMAPSLTDIGGDIDWGDMLNTDTSRVGPEGGNTETEVISVIRPIQKD